MTVEYVLLLVSVFAIGLKFFASAPMDAFKDSAPRLGARVESQMLTGTGFKYKDQTNGWEQDK